MRRLALAALLLACKTSPQAPASAAASPAPALVRAPDTAGDRDTDGVPDARDACPDEPEDRDEFEDDDGCVDRDNDRDGVPDAHEWIDGRYTNCDRRVMNGNEIDRRNLPEDLDGVGDHDGCPDAMCSDSCLVKLPERLRLDRRGRPLPGSDASLDAVAETLRAAPEIEISVEAHIDAQRDAAAARRATKRTAEAVVAALVRRGIEQARLTPIGWGDEMRSTATRGRSGGSTTDASSSFSAAAAAATANRRGGQMRRPPGTAGEAVAPSSTVYTFGPFCARFTALRHERSRGRALPDVGSNGTVVVMPRRPSQRLPFAATLLANLVACAGPAAMRPSARPPADSAAASDASAASVPPAPAPAGDAEAPEAQVRHGRTTSVVPPVPAQDNSDADIWDGPDTIDRVDPRAPARRR